MAAYFIMLKTYQDGEGTSEVQPTPLNLAAPGLNPDDHKAHSFLMNLCYDKMWLIQIGQFKCELHDVMHQLSHV